MENWKDVFCQQVDCGKFWKNLFKDEFDSHAFLDRSDAVYICKKAQADVYESTIEFLEDMGGDVDPKIVKELKKRLEEHWEKDDSTLGMVIDGKQIK